MQLEATNPYVTTIATATTDTPITCTSCVKVSTATVEEATTASNGEQQGGDSPRLAEG